MIQSDFVFVLIFPMKIVVTSYSDCVDPKYMNNRDVIPHGCVKGSLLIRVFV